MTLTSLVWIAIGGAVGAIIRYYVYELVQVNWFPLATLIVNVIASFIVGFVLASIELSNIITQQMRIAILTGFCGALSTFSTFAFDNYVLLQDRKYLLFIINIVANVTLTLLAIRFGEISARYILG